MQIHPFIGQTVTIGIFVVQIVAIASHYDIMDVLVISAKSDNMYITYETDKWGESYQHMAFLANDEELAHSYVERAFGISV